ncbi:PD40 domain-containing protein [Candidatus Bathyarchaeota archaeon]|nr:PD40 domain-containing protein [Candidatus Bathyarchaeota archaeon]
MAKRAWVAIAVLALIIVLAIVAASTLLNMDANNNTPDAQDTVPHEGKYGIYVLDLATEKVELLYSTDNEGYTSALRLNSQGEKLVFAQKTGANDESTEIFTINVDGQNLEGVTDNSYWDLYPAWSPDGMRIAFLSKRNNDLDIYMMNADGSNQHMFYDSGSHDADIDWAGNTIVFTSGHKIWSIKDDGAGLTQITNPANAGQWGQANLPIGDYDPRLRPDGAKIVFEKLEDPSTTHGSYNIFTVNSDGTQETRLTNTNYSQGLASWSHSGDSLVYVVSAINSEGKYDMYMMEADGSDNHNVTPEYFASNFLCYSPKFSLDDSEIYFVGQWYE